MEEYIKKLLEQVRFQKAHKAIGDEIRGHIEDQIEENISEGMDNETAERIAVRDMGDPVEAGIRLDKVHRPRIAWSVIISVLVVAIIGVAIQLFLDNDSILMEQGQYYTPNESSSHFIVDSMFGIFLMLAIYFIDYTVIAKYSRIIAIIWATFFMVTALPNAAYGLFVDSEAMNYKDMPFMINILDSMEWRLSEGVLLLVPLYAGILYKYKGQKGRILSKALLWIGIPVFCSFMEYRKLEYVIIAICMLVELTIAMRKGWIQVQKKTVMLPIWGSFILTIVISYINLIKNYTYNVADETHKKVIDSIYLFGSGTYYGLGDFQKPSSCFVPNPTDSGVLTYISTTWGAFWAIVVFAIVIGMIVFGFVALSKSKNHLGIIMGSGCMMWLAVNAIANIISTFVVLPRISGYTFLPFVSNNYYFTLRYSYVALGILLSIYKYKDSYSRDVKIESVGIHNLLKELNL